MYRSIYGLRVCSTRVQGTTVLQYVRDVAYVWQACGMRVFRGPGTRLVARAAPRQGLLNYSDLIDPRF